MVPYTHTPPEPKLEAALLPVMLPPYMVKLPVPSTLTPPPSELWFPVMLPLYMVKLPITLTPQPIASLLPWVILPLPLQSVRMKLTPSPTAIVLVPAAPVMV